MLLPRLQRPLSFGQLTQVRHPDPTQARRGRLLSILLLGTGAAAVIGVALTMGAALLGAPGWTTDTTNIVVAGLALLVLVVGLYFLNRRVSPRAAAILFLAGLVLILAFSDVPEELTSGRTTITFVLPIIMASVILGPTMSFLVAGLACGVLLAVAVNAGLADPLPLTTVLGFFLVALVGWLAASSLEKALADLQAINRELDQRVADRTRDLAAALVREQAEASRSQAILESIADGVIVFDNAGRALTANPALSQLLEQPRADIVGRGLHELMADAVPEADQLDVIRELGRPAERRPPLKVRWDAKTLSMSFAPVRGGVGEQSGIVAVFRDFTREAEVERMKSAFVSMVSHELRTPLGAILGFVEILSEGVHGPLAPKQHNVVVRILNNTKRLLSLVGDLLDQAQIEAGALSFHLADFNPTELVDGVVSILTNTAQSRNIGLTWHVAADVPKTLHGDPQRLHQILLNLASNALKFTQQGSVGVRVFCPDPAHWALEVADTGVGIPPEAQASVFEPFKQVDSSDTRQYSGVGLGLSIVKKLVDLMHGTIILVSAPGQGSTFTVTLPLTLNQEANA
jgi:PAS domain S-box-containing protein